MLDFQITNVLGETRAIPQIYSWDEDGQHFTAYNCPFCTSAVSTQRNVTTCENPWCSANPMMPIDAALKQKAQAETRKREDEERERNHRWAMERIRKDNERRALEYRAFVERVQAAGGCLRCSDHYRGKVRKHRKACPKAT